MTAKYIIVIPEGAAGEAIDDLDGLTALQAANTPNLDSLAKQGRVGLVATTPPGSIASEEVTLPCLLGYDPLRYPMGRAALDAAGVDDAHGNPLEHGPWLESRATVASAGRRGTPQRADRAVSLAFRIDFIHIDEHERIVPPCCALTIPQTRRILEDLGREINQGIEAEHVSLTTIGPGAGLLLTDLEGDQSETVLHPVGSIFSRQLRHVLPTGRHAELVTEIMQLSEEMLQDHELNALRIEAGEPPITRAWIWGAANTSHERFGGLPRFASQFGGLCGSMIADGPVAGPPLGLTAAGFGRMIGWDARYAPSMEPAQVAAEMLDKLNSHDIVCCVLHDAIQASHDGDPVGKVAAIERIDAEVIGPLAAALREQSSSTSGQRWRMLVAPSLRVRTDTGASDVEPVPFLLAGYGVSSIVERQFDEPNAEGSDLYAEVGSELMEYVLFGSGMRKLDP